MFFFQKSNDNKINLLEDLIGKNNYKNDIIIGEECECKVLIN